MVVPTMFRDSTRGSRIALMAAANRSISPQAIVRAIASAPMMPGGVTSRKVAFARTGPRAINGATATASASAQTAMVTARTTTGFARLAGGVVEATGERSTGKGFGSSNEGHRSEDNRSVTRDQAYRDYDQALSSAWQNGRTE